MKRLLLLITICISLFSFGQAINDIEIITKGWAPYTKIPLKQRDTLDLYIFVRNNGQTIQSNIVGSVTIDGTIFNTSNSFSLAGGEVDTILLGQFIPPNFNGIHEFIFDISCDSDDNLTNNTQYYSIEYTSREYSLDNNNFSGLTYNYFLNEAFGNIFQFNESDTISYVSVYIPLNTPLDIEVGVTINTTSPDWELIGEGLSNPITSNHLGNWLDIPLDGGPIVVPSNKKIMVWINDYGQGLPRALSSNSCLMNTSFSSTTNVINNCLYPGIVGDNYSQGTGMYVLFDSICTSAQMSIVKGNFMIRLKTQCISSETTLDLTSCTPIAFDNQIYSQSGSHTLVYNDINGCDSIINLNINIPYNPFQVSLCIVGVNNNVNNRVVWEKPITTVIDSFYIYRESTQSGIYDLIGATAYSDSALFTDSNSDPSVQAYRYKISSVDTCGNESPLSQEHKTIHLTINQGVGSDWNLIWSQYEGFNFTTYEIYRGTNPSNLTFLTSIQNTLNSYTDQSAPAGNIYYQIVAVNPNGCNPAKSNGYSSSKSNIANTSETSSITELVSQVLIHPNPTSTSFTITSKNSINSSFKLIDIQGKVVLKGKIESTEETVDISKLSKGQYNLVFEDENISPISIIKN